MIFGIATSVSSLNAIIASFIAGTVIKRPTLFHWRKLFIVFFIVYFIGGIIFILLGSAVPEKWATFRAQEQNQVHTEEEEAVPMQEQQTADETTQNEHANA